MDLLGRDRAGQTTLRNLSSREGRSQPCEDFSAAFQPFLLLVSGFTGSGKSTMAHELGARLDMKVINSDEVRKRMSGKEKAEIVPLNEGIYSPAMTENTYDAMAAEANEEIAAARGVILDATFGQRAQREKFATLARRENVPLLVIRCLATETTIAERLRSRAAAGEKISDGRWEIYAAQKRLTSRWTKLPLPLSST